MAQTAAANFAERSMRMIKIIRVSKVGKRTTERFVSPEDQDKNINTLAVGKNWTFVASFTELNQSGLRTKLEKRKGLYPALLMVEAGEADGIVFGFRDRMARNNIVEDTFLGRVGQVGGQVWAADMGQIKTDTAVERLQNGMLALVQRYMAESTADKTQGPKERAVAMGIAPFPIIPVGYRRFCDIPGNEGSTDRHIVVFEPERYLVTHAYELREEGAPLDVIRDWLRSQGHHIQIRGVQEMLKKRFYLGEMRFGKLVNLNSHEAIIDKKTFDSVQSKRATRGPRVGEFMSTRLLARQGLVHCAYCKHAMTVGNQTKPSGVKYYDYRCPSMGDCTSRVAISADVLEQMVTAYVKRFQMQGHASFGERVAEAQAAVTIAERDLKQATKNLAIIADTAAAHETLAELNAKLVQAKSELEALQVALGPAHTVSFFADWDRTSLQRKRRLLRIVIKTIEVSRGRGPERVRIESFLT